MAGVRRAPAIFFAATMTLHPATLLLGWLAAAIALQWLPLPSLVVVALAIFPASGYFAKKRFGLLLRRARWLLLSVAILFALATPGTTLPEPLGNLGFTTEGCLGAATHVLRLTLLLALLALLLERQTISRLIGGLYLLLAPFARTLDRARIALRLLLVLEYVEAGDRPRHWRDWLDPPPSATEDAAIELDVPHLRVPDYCAIAAIGMALALTIALGRPAP